MYCSRIYLRLKFVVAALVCAVTAAFVCACGNEPQYTPPDIAPHLSAAPDPAHTVAAESWQEYVMPILPENYSQTEYREHISLLYDTVVYDRKKPVFESASDPAERVYAAAVNILNRYVTSEQSGGSVLSTLHTVHDYLAYYTEYDHELYEKYTGGNTDVGNDPSFYIDGVLLENKGVCDGIARTFNFLCALEGIDSVRVTGSFASAPHAWNKVRLDGEWYNVDVTSDCAAYSINGRAYKQIAHGYFMLGDDTYKRFDPKHDFSQSPLVAERDLDHSMYFEPTVNIGGKSFPRVITSSSALNSVFAAVAECDGKVGKLELKLDFPNKMHVNDIDAYYSEIYSAYQKVENARFGFSGGSVPYFRYPNGVYLFLIY